MPVLSFLALSPFTPPPPALFLTVVTRSAQSIAPAWVYLLNAVGIFVYQVASVRACAAHAIFSFLPATEARIWKPHHTTRGHHPRHRLHVTDA